MLIQITEKEIQFLIELGNRSCKSQFETMHFNEVARNLIEQTQSKSYDLQMQKLQKMVEEKEKKKK